MVNSRLFDEFMENTNPLYLPLFKVIIIDSHPTSKNILKSRSHFKSECKTKTQIEKNQNAIFIFTLVFDVRPAGPSGFAGHDALSGRMETGH